MGKGNIEEVETVVSTSLRIGVLLAAAVMLIGLFLFLSTGESGYVDDVYPTNLLLILQDAVALKPYAVMLVGLLILILTPVFRVGISIILFLKEKDYLYARITAVVFTILIVSFLLGKVE